MISWEVDIELRVRKTLHLAGPTSEDALRDMLPKLLDGLDINTFAKYEPGFPPRPVEVTLDNDPSIVAVRRVEP